MKTSTSYFLAGTLIISLTLFICPLKVLAQEAESSGHDPQALLAAAKEIMETTEYCALITLDASGNPQARTMDPFLPDKEMVVWLGTNYQSRKVREIRHDSRVSLYYEAPEGGGYAVIQGRASIVDDPYYLEKYWKKEWEEFYPDKSATFALIKVVPKKLEVVYYKHGIVGSSESWAVPFMMF